MNQNLTLFGPHKDFESIKHLDENGVEFWVARELMPILGYNHWQKSEEVIARAARACLNSGQVVDNHFNRTVKMVKIGSNTIREVKDWKLDRFACYLVAQNGDPFKQEIAQAQTYFAIQTRRQEINNLTSADEQRLFSRNKIKEKNKNLASTAKRAGVTQFGSFNDAGYLGLYGMKVRDIEKHKNINRGELLDRAGSEELGANLFRITQTEAKIRKENIYGQDEASQTHFKVGSKVRQTIREIGGTMPELLPMEKHIKDVKKDLKKLKRGK
jgi:DNA-damage-inducible protein D